MPGVCRWIVGTLVSFCMRMFSSLKRLSSAVALPALSPSSAHAFSRAQDATHKMRTLSRYPRAFSRFGLQVRSVFGAASAVLASPLRDAAHAPRLPHLLIHCEREAAGLWPVEGVMQRFIAGNAYAAALKSASINVEVVEIRSNHWSMLNSAGLRLALTECLLVKSWP
eukprot:5423531-Pleurochrysis_carterae.AAC.4